jgi:hypothetical protein
MPLQNRVTPLSELIAHPGRGLVYGNRGCLHNASGTIVRRWATRRWIACRLEFRGWHREPLLQPGKFTELFFLDEATAFAAGHRPCALCRREDYVRFGELFPGPTGADAMDEQLHRERVDGRERRLHEAALDELPNGIFVLVGGEPCLVIGSELLCWTPAGYTERRPREAGMASLLTPPSLVEILRAGWEGVVPLLHPTATQTATELSSPKNAR